MVRNFHRRAKSKSMREPSKEENSRGLEDGAARRCLYVMDEAMTHKASGCGDCTRNEVRDLALRVATRRRCTRASGGRARVLRRVARGGDRPTRLRR